MMTPRVHDRDHHLGWGIGAFSRPAVIAAIVGAGVLGAGCSDSGPSRSEVVSAITAENVPASFDAAAATATEVAPAVQEWCSNGDATAVRQAIETARGAWIELEPFGFGPVNERRSMFIIDPQIRDADVDALGADDGDGTRPAVDAAALRDLAGADQRGWGAIEHLVAGEPTPRRCDYATGAAELTAEELAAVAEEWATYGVEIGNDDESANVALRNIVSESLFAVQMMVDDPDPVVDAQRLAGVRRAILGTAEIGTDVGISPLLSDDLVTRLTAEFDEGDPATLQVAIGTDVVGALGTTVNFSDADGDG